MICLRQQLRGSSRPTCFYSEFFISEFFISEFFISEFFIRGFFMNRNLGLTGTFLFLSFASSVRAEPDWATRHTKYMESCVMRCDTAPAGSDQHACVNRCIATAPQPPTKPKETSPEKKRDESTSPDKPDKPKSE